jgi:hypothetical protein
MTPKKKYRIQAHATTKTYVSCWIAARRALDIARQKQAGNLYFRMMAGVFCAFTIEAFLNHLGQRRIPEWKAFERKLGPREKLLMLRTTLHLSFDPSRRPFQTLHDILKLRDSLAHGKTETVSNNREVRDPDDPSANYPEPDWKRLCEPTSLTRMVQDAEAMVRALHSKAGYKSNPFLSPGSTWSSTSELPDD